MLQDQEIGRELFGYKKDDVDRHLADLHRSLRLTKEENTKLKNELAEAREKLSSYEDMSSTLKKTVINAEKTASEIIEKAQEEADEIISKASKRIKDVAVEEPVSDLSESIRIEESFLHNDVKKVLERYIDVFGSPEILENAPEDLKNSIIDIQKRVQSQKPADELSSYERNMLNTSLSELASIKGVGAVWIFNNYGQIVESYNHLGIDLKDTTLALVSLDRWSERFESNLPGVKTKSIFVEFNKFLLFINPINSTLISCILSSINAPVGHIFQVLDKELSKIQKALY